MKTMLYWTIQHLRRAAHDIRFALSCWWLTQQVEFLEWRMRLEVLIPQTQAVPVPVLPEQGGRYAVRTV